MLLCYLDESYTADRYYIATLAVPDDAARSLTRALDDVVRKAATEHGVDEKAELHGHALMHGKEDWALMGPKIRARIGVYDAAMKAMGDHDVHVILRGVNVAALKKRYVKPYPPHSVVLQHTLERINGLSATRGHRALLIADELPDQDQYRDDLGAYQELGTPGYLPSQLTNIVDTIHFAPSRASRLLQAADLIAYMHRRIETHTETDPRAIKARERMWSHVEPRVHHRWTWWP